MSIVAILVAVLVVSAVFASGVINPSVFTLNSMYGPGPTQATTVFVDPDTIIGDYFDPGFSIGDLVLVRLNVTDVTDLFTWQANVTWNPAVLNYTGVASYGDFLSRTPSPYGTSRTQPISVASNESGYAAVAETILGNYAGITGAGSLATLEFEVVGYGCSNFTISTVGDLPTTLLDSTGAAIAFTSIDGYFKNKLLGDSNGDGTVTLADMGLLSASWTGVVGALPYSRDTDNNDDGVITLADMGITSANWGRTAP